MTTTEALDALAANFDDLGLFLDALVEIAPTIDEEQAVILRAQLEGLSQRLRGAIGTVDYRLIQLVQPGQTVTVPGCGQVSVEAKGKQTTDGTKLALRLAARVADTPCNEDGEPLPPSELCRLTAEELVAVFAINTPSTRFRSGEVKARGLRPGEFSSWADGEPRVKFMAGG